MWLNVENWFIRVISRHRKTVYHINLSGRTWIQRFLTKGDLYHTNAKYYFTAIFKCLSRNQQPRYQEIDKRMLWFI